MTKADALASSDQQNSYLQNFLVLISIKFAAHAMLAAERVNNEANVFIHRDHLKSVTKITALETCRHASLRVFNVVERNLASV